MRLPSAAAAALLIFVACGREPAARVVEEPPPTLEVTDAFVYAPLTAAQTGGYFVVHNHGALEDTLVAVGARWAEDGMLHRTEIVDGRVRMSHTPSVPVPAGDSIALRPGALHVMLLRLRDLPAEGDTVVLRLAFASGQVVEVRAAVRAYGDEP